VTSIDRRSSYLRAFVAAFTLAVTTAFAAGSQTIPLPDPALGMVEGQLSILPGWKGSAVIDRASDPFGGGTAAVSIDLQSPDGSRGYRALPIAFHLFGAGMHRMVAIGPQQAAAFGAFNSTAELLTLQILPRLNLNGSASPPFPIDRERIAAAAAAHAGSALPTPFIDSAAVIVTNAATNQEILVEAVTIGSGRGMPNESSLTHVQLFRAPIGQARALHDEIARLPELKPDADWMRADRALNDRKIAENNRQGAQGRAQMQADSNARFEAWKRSSAAQRAQYDQHNAAWAEGQQQKSDRNALFNGYIGDHDVSYKWCNASTGAVRYVTNATQSPGAGFQRCP
jgi:hypothetical protein